MSKLLPPIIDGIIPAFYTDDKKGTQITVPFSSNRAVSPAQVGGFALKLKTVQSTTYLFDLKIKSTDEIPGFDKANFNYATFTLTDDQVAQLRRGQYYKVQIAYIDLNDIVGHFSSVGSIKYTTKPELSIMNLDSALINSHKYNYTGIYSQQGKDITEKVYSYQFDVYDELESLYYTSGEQIHNASEDTEQDNSADLFKLPQDLPLNKSFYIKYSITTNNGLTLSTPKYRIMQKISIDPDIKADLKAELDFENGYIDIFLTNIKNRYDEDTPVVGAYVLSRASSDTNFEGWEELYRIRFIGQYPTKNIWRDFTVEQGKIYKYSLQQYNDIGLYSNRIVSNKIIADFEHAFLYDGQRQLKIKYNPKVTNFKTAVPEAKTETIGNKHPFIFRNGKVYYHEFPISGLISYFVDEEKMFLTEEEFAVEEKTTNLIGSNIYNERFFKLKVLEWLTDGKPKLFRSPGEGNYIVRLMNVSLAPNDPTGRMLHTFNCTAYEIADFTCEDMDKYGILDLSFEAQEVLQFETIQLGKEINSGVLNKYPTSYIKIENAIPGDRYILTFEDGVQEIIMIGVTGSYQLKIGKKISKIEIPEGLNYYQGSLTYSYMSIQENVFDTVHNVEVIEVPSQQFIGEHNVIEEIEGIYIDGEYIKNPKLDIIQVYSIIADDRIVMNTQKEIIGDSIVLKTQGGQIIDSPNDFVLYAFGEWNVIDIYNSSRVSYDYKINGYYDYHQKKEYSKEEYQPMIQINNNILYMTDYNGMFNAKDMGRPSILKVGNGSTMEVSYQLREIEYLIELDDNYPVKAVKKNYEKSVEEFQKFLAEEIDDMEEERKLQKAVDDSYKIYIKTLADELKKLRE